MRQVSAGAAVVDDAALMDERERQVRFSPLLATLARRSSPLLANTNGSSNTKATNAPCRPYLVRLQAED